MKNILCLFLTLTMLALCGCSPGNETKPGPAAVNQKCNHESAHYDYIVATDKFDSAPFVVNSDVRNPEGLNFDIIEALGRDQGISFEIQILNSINAMESLRVGLCDAIILSFEIPEEYKELFLASKPYFTDGFVFASSEGQDGDIGPGMEGKTVGIFKMGKETVPARFYSLKYGFNIEEYLDRERLYEDVKNKSIDFIFQRYSTVGSMIKKNGGVKIVGEKTFETEYRIYVMKGNESLLEKINDGIDNITESGEYETILTRYIDSGLP